MRGLENIHEHIRRLKLYYTKILSGPIAGSGSTLRAALELGRKAYGFEIDKKFYSEAKYKMLDEEYADQIVTASGEIWTQGKLSL